MSHQILEFVESLKIKILNSSPYYGQVESSNKTLIKLVIIYNNDLEYGAHKTGNQWKHEGHEGFRLIRASWRITTIRPVFWCIMIHCV
jgi:hypothetical protein